jgi:hypothetical protein
VVTSRLIELGFEALFEKEESLSFIFIEEDSRESKGLFRAKVKDYILYLHPFSSSNHFLIIDFGGMVPLDFTFPLIISEGVGRIPYWPINFGSVT